MAGLNRPAWIFPAYTLLATLGIGGLGLATMQTPSDQTPAITAEMFRDGFESAPPQWSEEGGDANRTLRVHDRIAAAHSGSRCERIQLTAGAGTHIYYGYPISRALLTEDLTASLWVKADRPGVQVLCRVVFPRERDPDTSQLLGTLVPGKVYEQVGLWQRLDLSKLDIGVERQARLLRASLNRDIDTHDAYVDRVILDLYAGAGDITVLIDDLEVGPIIVDRVRAAGAQLGLPGGSRSPKVEISQDRLLVDDRPRFLRAIRAPRVSPETLREFGFNAVSVEWPIDITAVERTVNSGMWLMPQLPGTLDEPDGSAPDIARVLAELPFAESVLCWSVGSRVHEGSWKSANKTIQDLRSAGTRRPIAMDVAGNLRGYSREVDMLSAHRMPLGSSMHLRDYRDWLSQRRYLARPGTYFFTWVQASPETHWSGHVLAEGNPQPDQLRLLTYSALAAGCRGLGFWGDEMLGQPGPGRQRLLQLGLLNLELQLLEPYFASAGSASTVSVETTAPPTRRGPGADTDEKRGDVGGKRRIAGAFAPLPKRQPVPLTGREDVQATLLRNDRGLVVIPIWYGKGAQYVAGQMAANDLNIVVPGIPDAAQAWQISPAEVHMIKRERVSGGTRLVVPEFDLTSIVLMSSETASIEQLRREVSRTAPFAATWASELASLKVTDLKKVNAELVALGHAQPDGQALIHTAEEHLNAARSAMDRGDFGRCYAESHRAMRAVRLLERAHWEDSVTACTHFTNAPSLSLPVSSPYTTSFAALPRHWRMVREIQSGDFSQNLVSGGDFESADKLSEDGWAQLLDTGDPVELSATLSGQNPHRGERSLHLEVKPKEGGLQAATLNPMLAALVSKPIPVKAGDILRIRFWLRVPAAIQGSPEGAILYDSIGGRTLAVTWVEPLEWKQFTLYRYATRSDLMTMTIGMTGIGELFVDDFAIERAVPATPLTRQKQSQVTR